MPHGSALARAVTGAEADWATGEYLLANVFDAIRENTWATAQANSRKKLQRPKEHPRPERRHHGRRLTAEEWQTKRAEWRERETRRLMALGELPDDWQMPPGWSRDES